MGEQTTQEEALGGGALFLEEVLAYAQEHNPAIEVAQSRWLAAQKRPAQVSALDDPMFTYEGFNIPENFDLTRTDNNILKLSQKLPFPGKRRLRGELANYEAAIAREELRMVRGNITRRGEESVLRSLAGPSKSPYLLPRERAGGPVRYHC